MVSRLHKQNSGLIEEISALHNQNTMLKAKSQELIEKSVSNQLLAATELGDLQIGNIELKNQVLNNNSLCAQQCFSMDFFCNVGGIIPET